MYKNNQWHGVCLNRWDDTDAGVVCRQLGFGSMGIALRTQTQRVYSGLGNLMCNGNESSLLDCDHHGVNTNCGYYRLGTWVICGKLYLQYKLYARLINMHHRLSNPISKWNNGKGRKDRNFLE